MDRKKAIVTGGSSGIGRGIVYGLAEDGYDVVFSYWSKAENAKKVAAELSQKYPEGQFICIEAELTKEGAGVEFFRKAVELLGNLDLMVNNAGVTILESVFELTEENMDYLIRLQIGRAHV